jgi:hypothetical protein
MKHVIACALALAPLCPARAQQPADFGSLVHQGYELKAAYNIAQYSDRTVLYLQKGGSLYVCVLIGSSGGVVNPAALSHAPCTAV